MKESRSYKSGGHFFSTTYWYTRRDIIRKSSGDNHRDQCDKRWQKENSIIIPILDGHRPDFRQEDSMLNDSTCRSWWRVAQIRLEHKTTVIVNAVRSVCPSVCPRFFFWRLDVFYRMHGDAENSMMMIQIQTACNEQQQPTWTKRTFKFFRHERGNEWKGHQNKDSKERIRFWTLHSADLILLPSPLKASQSIEPTDDDDDTRTGLTDFHSSLDGHEKYDNHQWRRENLILCSCSKDWKFEPFVINFQGQSKRYDEGWRPADECFTALILS